jgi:flagellin
VINLRHGLPEMDSGTGAIVSLEFKEEFCMGSFSILNNISGLNSQNQLNANNVNLNRTLSRLSSGKRINTGADDAAGLQIADSLRANTYALNQAVRNANDGNAVAQIADGALQEVTNLLTRAVTLAEESANGTIDSNGRTSLNNEFTQIQSEIGRIASTVNFNGATLLKAGDTTGLQGSLNVFVGDINGASSITVSIGTITVSGSSSAGFTVSQIGSTAGVGNLAGIDLTKADKSDDALTTIKGALNSVSTMRANIGAGMNRLQSSITVLQTQSQNTLAAESSIRDANVAEEVSNMTKYQILSQAGIAALSQANSSSQSVLSLLR